MTLWIVFAVLSLIAIGFVVWPILRGGQRMLPLAVVAVIGIVALSTGLYYYQGRPDVSSGVSGPHEMNEVVSELAARLESNPDDANGWKMLGRSYMTLGNFPGAVQAFGKANELESGRDAPTLVALGEARLSEEGGTITQEVSALFENALAIDPNNPQALFYSGVAAAEREDTALAANRWERLLSLNPPAEIEGILRRRVAEWRGETVPEAETAMPPAAAETAPQVAEADSGAIVTVDLSLSAEARAALPGEAGIFVIARDPAQPSPPIAVTRRRLSELPATVSLGDRESMVAGRALSGFAEFEVVARVTLSGQPMQKSGDWYGAITVRPAEKNEVGLVIDTVVP